MRIVPDRSSENQASTDGLRPSVRRHSPVYIFSISPVQQIFMVCPSNLSVGSDFEFWSVVDMDGWTSGPSAIGRLRPWTPGAW